MPGAGSWPYTELQCPHCSYFHQPVPPWVDDSGYEMVGFCRHPRIAMELFRTQKRDLNEGERCRLFVRAAVSPEA